MSVLIFRLRLFGVLCDSGLCVVMSVVRGVVWWLVVISICVRWGCRGSLVIVCLCFVICLWLFKVLSMISRVCVLESVVVLGVVRNVRFDVLVFYCVSFRVKFVKLVFLIFVGG